MGTSVYVHVSKGLNRLPDQRISKPLIIDQVNICEGDNSAQVNFINSLTADENTWNLSELINQNVLQKVHVQVNFNHKLI